MDTSSHVLPDQLIPGLHIVFVGTVVGKKSEARGHYYSHPTNRFWRRLHETGLTPRQLDPSEDAKLPEYGIGLTDLNKTDASSHDDEVAFDVPDFLTRIEACRPRWIVFNGKAAAKAYCRSAGLRQPSYGLQEWTVRGSRVFVVPQSSGMNGDGRVLDGRTNVEWWRALGTAVAI